jgi:hypothetical protein
MPDLTIDVVRETDPIADLRMRAKAAIEAPPPQAPASEAPRKFIPREIPIVAKTIDPYTGAVLKSYTITSRVMDGAESAQVARLAAQYAGISAHLVSANDANWFRSLARAEVQIRAVVGNDFMPDAEPAKRRDAFVSLLWNDPELLGGVTEGLVEHEARFRLGDPREGEGAPKFYRVVVDPIWQAGA